MTKPVVKELHSLYDWWVKQGGHVDVGGTKNPKAKWIAPNGTLAGVTQQAGRRTQMGSHARKAFEAQLRRHLIGLNGRTAA